MERGPEPRLGEPCQVMLRFAADGARRTWLAHQNVVYPFHVGRCLSLPGDPLGMAALYVQCCSGGIFEGERLEGYIEALEGTQVHVSTSASTIVHSMPKSAAEQVVTLNAHEGAFLEYLPEPLILFPDARLSNRTCIRWHPSATVLVWDAVLSHDPQATDANAEARWFGRYQSDLSVRAPDGRLLVRDRYALSGSLLAERLPGVNGLYTCQAGFMLLHRRAGVAALIQRLRDALDADGTIYAGVSSLPNDCGVFVRVLAHDAVALRLALNRAWGASREEFLGVRPGARRK